MSAPVVYSIGVPVFNQVATIGKTIDSILDQVRPFDLVWVSDNHSTDGTKEVLASYGERIRVVRPETHLSMVDNWNYLIDQMDCDWFSLLSGDDFIYPEFAVVMRDAIERRLPSDVVFHAGIEIVDDNRNVIGTRHLKWHPKRMNTRYSVWTQMSGPTLSFGSFCASKSAWKKVGGFPSNFQLIQDWGFWLRMAKVGTLTKASSKILAQYTAVERPEEDADRLDQWLSDFCKIYDWIVREAIYELSEDTCRSFYRNRFLSHLNKYRKYSSEDQKRILGFMQLLGKKAGYSEAEVEQRLEEGRSLSDTFFRRRMRLHINFIRLIAFVVSIR